ncbi:hypothetical protein Taro_005618 [Colocasia esculenta]|uniref:Retrotransposon gag domain-containing protein n=1 Tax=Colocasia esculenta TaxID=4460 RepID=A0A843TTM2_COLES|nr:hypothetical protein [Colocasia esculenta]
MGCSGWWCFHMAFGAVSRTMATFVAKVPSLVLSKVELVANLVRIVSLWCDRAACLVFSVRQHRFSAVWLACTGIVSVCVLLVPQLCLEVLVVVWCVALSAYVVGAVPCVHPVLMPEWFVLSHLEPGCNVFYLGWLLVLVLAPCVVLCVLIVSFVRRFASLLGVRGVEFSASGTLCASLCLVAVPLPLWGGCFALSRHSLCGRVVVVTIGKSRSPLQQSGGSGLVERRRLVRSGGVASWERGGGGNGVMKALRGSVLPKLVGMLVPFLVVVWGTPGCSIPAVDLPADVTTVEHVATSEKVSPQSGQGVPLEPSGGNAVGCSLRSVTEVFRFLGSCLGCRRWPTALLGVSGRGAVHACAYWACVGPQLGRAAVVCGCVLGCGSLASLYWGGCRRESAAGMLEVWMVVSSAGTSRCSSLTSRRVRDAVLTWLLGVSRGDTWLFLPDLVEVRDVGACVVRLWSHVVALVFRELLCLGGCAPRVFFRIVLLWPDPGCGSWCYSTEHVPIDARPQQFEQPGDPLPQGVPFSQGGPQQQWFPPPPPPVFMEQWWRAMFQGPWQYPQYLPYQKYPQYQPAKSWVHEIERTFETMDCAELDQVKLAVYQLKGSAHEWWRAVKSRVGPEMKQDLLLFSWSWRPGVAVDWLASRLVDVDCMNLAAVSVDAKGSEEWLDDRRTRGVAELREETSRSGAIPVGARGGLGVNREIVGDWGGGGDDPEESTQRMIERIWESLTDIRARMDHQESVPPVAVPLGDGEAVPIAPVPPRVEVPFAAPVPPPPVLIAEEPVMQVEKHLKAKEEDGEVVNSCSRAEVGLRWRSRSRVLPEVCSSSSSLSSFSSHRQVKSRVGPEMKQDLLLFSWSWRPGVAVDWLASRLVDVDCMNLAAVSVDAKGSEEWLDDRRTRGIAELREETSRRGAIPVGARGGLGVNREIVGEFPTEPVTREAHPCPHRLRPVRGRRTRIKYVIGLTGLAEAFRHTLHGEFFPDYTCRERRNQFHELVQGDLIVAQYHQRFVQLLRHVPHVVASDQAHTERFISGLCTELRWAKAGHLCDCLMVAVARATALERECQFLPQKSGGSGRSSPYQHFLGSRGSVSSSSSLGTGGAGLTSKLKKPFTRGGRHQYRQSQPPCQQQEQLVEQSIQQGAEQG